MPCIYYLFMHAAALGHDGMNVIDIFSRVVLYMQAWGDLYRTPLGLWG